MAVKPCAVTWCYFNSVVTGAFCTSGGLYAFSDLQKIVALLLRYIFRESD